MLLNDNCSYSSSLNIFDILPVNREAHRKLLKMLQKLSKHFQNYETKP